MLFSSQLSLLCPVLSHLYSWVTFSAKPDQETSGERGAESLLALVVGTAGKDERVGRGANWGRPTGEEDYNAAITWSLWGENVREEGELEACYYCWKVDLSAHKEPRID